MSRTDNLEASSLFTYRHRDGVHPNAVGGKGKSPILAASRQGQKGQMVCTFQEKTRILVFKKNLLGNNAALTNSICISGQGTLTLSHSLPLLQNEVGNSYCCLAWRKMCILPAFRRLKTPRCLIYFFTLDPNLTKP